MRDPIEPWERFTRDLQWGLTLAVLCPIVAVAVAWGIRVACGMD